MSYKMTIFIFTVVKTSDVPIYYRDFIILSCHNINVFFFIVLYILFPSDCNPLFLLHFIFKTNMIVCYIISCDSSCIIMHLTLHGGHIPRKTFQQTLLNECIFYTEISWFIFSTASKFAYRHTILPCVFFFMSVQNEKTFKATKYHQTYI